MTAIVTSFVLRADQPPARNDPIDAIARLASLHAAGHIPDDEFAAARAALVRSIAAAPTREHRPD